MQRRAQQDQALRAASSAQLWLVTGLRDQHAHALAPRLTAAERTRAGRLHLPEARTRFVVARAVLRTLLGVWLDLPASQVPLTTTDRGKPVVDLTDAPHVSVAHTADVALIALHADLPLGVDIEASDRIVDDAVISRSCTDGELDVLRTVDPEQRAACFLRYWVRKEAVAKADGYGLARSLRTTDVSETGWARRPDGDPRTWVQDVEVGPGHLAALATVDRPTMVNVTRLALPRHLEVVPGSDPLASLLLDRTAQAAGSQGASAGATVSTPAPTTKAVAARSADPDTARPPGHGP